MRLDRQKREIKTIDLLPLINVVFLLILFVLVAGRPTTNHPQNLQVADTRIEAAHQPAAVSVVLAADDQFSLPGARPQSLEQLADYLVQQGIAEQGLPVELIADRTASAGALLAFRQTMAKAGIGEIRLKTQYIGADNGR